MGAESALKTCHHIVSQRTNPFLVRAAVSVPRWTSLTRALPIRDLVAMSLAGCGALMVFVSFLVDWQLITVGGGATVRAGIADIPTWGTAYVLGSMVLIAVFVGVVVLPTAFGAPARVLGIAWALGIAGIITALLVRLTDTPAISSEVYMTGFLGTSNSSVNVTVKWGSGIIYSASAVIMLIGAFIMAYPPLKDVKVGSAGIFNDLSD